MIHAVGCGGHRSGAGAPGLGGAAHPHASVPRGVLQYFEQPNFRSDSLDQHYLKVPGVSKLVLHQALLRRALPIEFYRFRPGGAQRRLAHK